MDSSTLSIILKATDLASAEIKNVQDQLKKLGAETDTTNSKTSNFAQGMKDLGGGLMDVGKKMTVGLTLPIIAAGAAALKMAGDFEQSLDVLQSVTGATATQMAQLSTRARELGQDAALPGISARNAAEAMTELAKAGVSVNDILSASKGVLSLAKAGNMEVAEAATVAARALNAFSLDGSKASQVADLLAAGANSSSADVHELALALSQAGSGASRMGLSLGDTITALALFSNAGINSSDAGTSLKTMLVRLAAPTEKAAGTMEELGLKFFDAKGNFIGLEKAAGQLNTKLKKLTQEQREQAIATIFGSDASRAASILAKAGAEEFNKMSKAVNRQGAATDLAAAQNKGFKGALDGLKSTVETLATDLGVKLLPPLTALLRKLAEGITKLSDAFSKLDPKTQSMIGIFVALVAIMGPLLAMLGGLATAVASIALIFGTSAGVVGLVVVGIGLLAAAVIYVVTHWNEMKKVVGEVFAKLTGYVNEHKLELQILAGIITLVMMPALVALAVKAVDTAIVMTAQAAITGARYVAASLATSAAWIAAFLKMTIGASATTIVMVAEAVKKGVAYAASANVSWSAWAGAFARMVAGAVATTIVAVAQAAAMGGAWAAAAAFIMSPIGIVIVVAAALAAIGYVIAKLIELKQANDQLNNSRANLDKVNSDIRARAAAEKDPVKKEKLLKIANENPKFATGVKNFHGGLALVGEQGPELVNLPRGSDVITAPETQKMMNGSTMQVTLNVNVGTYAGQPGELNQLAQTIWKAMAQVARQHGVADQWPSIGILPH